MQEVINAIELDGQHGGCDYGVRKKEGEKILEFFATINIAVGKILFQKESKSPIHL